MRLKEAAALGAPVQAPGAAGAVLKQLSFAFPFLPKAQGKSDAPTRFTDEHEVYKLLAQREPAGSYLVSKTGMWHGGFHVTEAGAGQALDLDAGVRCIADGHVIAYRLDRSAPVSEVSVPGGGVKLEAPYSTAFALVRHTMEFPKGTTLIFYSLYMHLQAYDEYADNSKRQKPAYWSTRFEVTEFAKDKPATGPSGMVAGAGQQGLRVRQSHPHGSVTAILPQGGSFSIGKQENGWGQITEVHASSLLPPLAGGFVEPRIAVGGWVFLGSENGGPLVKEMMPDDSFGRVVFPSSPPSQPGTASPGVPVKAGDLIGHLGCYDSLYECTIGTRMVHIEVFCDDSIDSYIKQSRAWVDAHGPSAKDWQALGFPTRPTILRISPRTKLYKMPDHEGADAPKTDVIQVYSLAELARDKNRQFTEAQDDPHMKCKVNWWHVQSGDHMRNPIEGWVREYNYPGGRVTREFAQAWIDFQCLADSHDPAHSIFESSAAWVDYAGGADVPDVAALYKLSPLMKDHVYRALFATGDGRRAADDLCSVGASDRGRYPWLMQASSRLIVKHESEWANPGKWKKLYEEIEKKTGTKPEHAEELKRIERLIWWDEVRTGVPGFPGPEVFHMHPVGLVGNFRAGFLFTLAMLQHIFPGAEASVIQDVINELNAHIDLFMLDSALRREHFMAQVKQETGPALQLHNESLNYAAQALTTGTFSYFTKHPKEADLYGRNKEHPANQEAIANRVYAGQDHNGSPESGDGYRYRGRGMIQLTHRGGYQRFTKWHRANSVAWPQDSSVDFEVEPETVSQIKYAVRSACYFWVENGLFLLADNGATQSVVDTITKIINPGLFQGKENKTKTESIDGRRYNFEEIHVWGGLE